jgi:outer membrane protein assembly factor BamB
LGRLATVVLAVALAGGLRSARAQPAGPPTSSQFELADTVQLDRADETVLAHLERVKACLADRQWDEAVETLRQVMENSRGELLAVSPLRYVSLSDACQMQLAALPAEALRLYRSRVDPVARSWYDEGIARRDGQLLRNVVERAFASSWGDKALLALGELALESAEFTTARWCWERIVPVTRGEGRAASGEQGQGDAETRRRGDAETRRQGDKENAAASPLATHHSPLTTRPSPFAPQPPNPPIPKTPNPQIPKSPNPQIPQPPNPQIPKSPNPQIAAWPGYPDTHLDPAAIRARLVLVSILEGSTARAGEELTQMTALHADARGWLGGREVGYVAALSELLGQSRLWPEPQPDQDWPLLAGSPERNKIAPEPIDVAGVAWRVPLPRLAEPAGSEIRPATPAADAAPLGYHPVVVGDRVFVCDQREIRALRLATGKAVFGDGGAAIYREAWEGPAAALANPADTLGTARFTMTIADGRLYARMGSAVTSQPQRQPAGPTVPGSLVALDLQAEGKLLWKVTPEEGWALEGAPVVQGPCVWAAMRRSDLRPQAHVACFDAATGRLRWRRFICGAETPARGVFPQSTSTLLTLAEGTLYCNTNLGAVAALSAADGRLLWVSLYPRQRRGSLLRLAPHWQRDLNPCLFFRGTLLAAPADSPRLFALDAATGQILWQTGTECEDIVDLLGVAGEQLIAGGQRLYWIGLAGPGRGSIRHVWPDGPDRPGYGRGVLAGRDVLWPARQKIYVFDQLTAQPRRVIELAPLGVGGGNLLAIGRRLLVATGTELIALARSPGQKAADGGRSWALGLGAWGLGRGTWVLELGSWVLGLGPRPTNCSLRQIPAPQSPRPKP